MHKHFRSRENRREWYMVLGLVWGTLTFTHWVWGWPIGIPSTVQVNSQTGGGVLGPIPWRHLLEGLPLLVVGLLYYLGRRHGKTTATIHSVPKEQEPNRRQDLDSGRLKDCEGQIAKLSRLQVQALKQVVAGAGINQFHFLTWWQEQQVPQSN